MYGMGGGGGGGERAVWRGRIETTYVDISYSGEKKNKVWCYLNIQFEKICKSSRSQYTRPIHDVMSSYPSIYKSSTFYTFYSTTAAST